MSFNPIGKILGDKYSKNYIPDVDDIDEYHQLKEKNVSEDVIEKYLTGRERERRRLRGTIENERKKRERE